MLAAATPQERLRDNAHATRRQAKNALHYHKFAELIGLRGIYVDKPDDVALGWDTALAADRPVVLEIKTDPEVAPLPPHITFKQMVNFTKTIVKGDPRESGIIKNTARQVLGAILPGGKDE